MKMNQKHFQTKLEFINNISKTGISPEYSQFTDYSVIGKVMFILLVFDPSVAPSLLVLSPQLLPLLFKSLCWSKTLWTGTSVQQSVTSYGPGSECPETNGHKQAHATTCNSHLSKARFPMVPTFVCSTVLSKVLLKYFVQMFKLLFVGSIVQPSNSTVIKSCNPGI